jgi:recombinational DNA repair protein RecT
MVIPDINFQKQLILKLTNCKKFFTAEVHEGIEVISDLATGNYQFIGKNDATKPTIGYYAKFITTDGEAYDCFMSCAEIIDRAKFSPQFKAENYKQTGNSIHFEKVVVRNLMKVIPKISVELQSTLSLESFQTETIEITAHEDVSDKQKPNAMEAAKKQISGKISNTKSDSEAMAENAEANFEAGKTDSSKTDAANFF